MFRLYPILNGNIIVPSIELRASKHYPLFLMNCPSLCFKSHHDNPLLAKIVLYEINLVSDNANISNLIAIFPWSKISHVTFVSCLHIFKTKECLSPCRLHILVRPIIWKRNIDLTLPSLASATLLYIICNMKHLSRKYILFHSASNSEAKTWCDFAESTDFLDSIILHMINSLRLSPAYMQGCFR